MKYQGSALLRTRCGCERRFLITLPAPESICLPLIPLGPVTFLDSGDTPLYRAQSQRRFERDLSTNPLDRRQRYNETSTWEAPDG